MLKNAKTYDPTTTERVVAEHVNLRCEAASKKSLNLSVTRMGYPIGQDSAHEHTNLTGTLWRAEKFWAFLSGTGHNPSIRL